MMTTLGTSANGHGLPGGRLRRVTEYIHQNLAKDLRLAKLAAVVCMSANHFARLFKYSTGVSPHRFVMRQRIARARGVLATSELSIEQISRMVGFRTPSHFTTVFRRVTGITPRGYRTEHLQETSLARSLEDAFRFSLRADGRTHDQRRTRSLHRHP